MIQNVIDLFLMEMKNQKGFEVPSVFHVLDLGCKQGEIVTEITTLAQGDLKIGVDMDAEFLNDFIPNKGWITIKADICEFDKLIEHLTSKHGFDISKAFILLTDVIEHMPPEQGKKLLQDIERYSPLLTLVSTPSGFTRQDPENYPSVVKGHDGQRHICGWEEQDLRENGYDTFIIGKRIPNDEYYTTFPYCVVDGIFAFKSHDKIPIDRLDLIIKKTLLEVQKHDVNKLFLDHQEGFSIVINKLNDMQFNFGKRLNLSKIEIIQCLDAVKQTIKGMEIPKRDEQDKDFFIEENLIPPKRG